MKHVELGVEGRPGFLEFCREAAVMENIARTVGAAFSGLHWLSAKGRINNEDVLVAEFFHKPSNADAERYDHLYQLIPEGYCLCEQWTYIFSPGEIGIKRKEFVSRSLSILDKLG